MTAHGKNIVKQHDNIDIWRKSASHDKRPLQKLGISGATSVSSGYTVFNINYGSIDNIVEAGRHVPANLIESVIKFC